MELPTKSHLRGLTVLSPLFVFFSLYAATSVLSGDFYKMPVTVAFIAASAWAFAVSKPASLNRRIELFSAGAAHRNIMMMIWIFIMAGAFASAAKYIGAVDATVNLTLAVLPANMLLPGLFLAACLISLSIGTSVGTIVALMPVAAGLADGAGTPAALMAGIVVGGAFFGDNLSFISDTTIAATRTQGCRMRDKFLANFAIVLPAALLVLVGYAAIGWSYEAAAAPGPIEWFKVAPYLLTLAVALLGTNVMIALLLGVAATGAVSLASPEAGIMDWAGALGKGMTGMGDLIIVTLLAGGMLELIRYNGGLQYIVSRLASHVRGQRGAELCIALMVAIANFCTANNTVAIVTVGDIARRIAERFNIPAPRAASLLDTFSCLIQGMLPYGAQLLMGASLANLSALEIIPYLYYPFVMGAFALGFILLGRRTAAKASRN